MFNGYMTVFLPVEWSSLKVYGALVFPQSYSFPICIFGQWVINVLSKGWRQHILSMKARRGLDKVFTLITMIATGWKRQRITLWVRENLHLQKKSGMSEISSKYVIVHLFLALSMMKDSNTILLFYVNITSVHC